MRELFQIISFDLNAPYCSQSPSQTSLNESKKTIDANCEFLIDHSECHPQRLIVLFDLFKVKTKNWCILAEFLDEQKMSQVVKELQKAVERNGKSIYHPTPIYQQKVFPQDLFKQIGPILCVSQVSSIPTI